MTKKAIGNFWHKEEDTKMKLIVHPCLECSFCRSLCEEDFRKKIPLEIRKTNNIE